MTPRALAALLALLLLALGSTGCSRQEQFIDAALRGDHAMVQAMVKSNASLVHAQDRYGRGTALNIAVAANDLESVRILLDAGSNPDFCAPSNGTPLQKACFQNEIEIVKELLAHKANINLAASGRNSHGTPLQYAALGGHLEMVRLLVEHGADVNGLDPTGFRPPALLEACAAAEDKWDERKQIVLYLLEHGADTHAPTYEAAGGDRVGMLHFTKMWNVPDDIVAILVAHGAREEPVTTPPAPPHTQPAS